MNTDVSLVCNQRASGNVFLDKPSYKAYNPSYRDLTGKYYRIITINNKRRGMMIKEGTDT